MGPDLCMGEGGQSHGTARSRSLQFPRASRVLAASQQESMQETGGHMWISRCGQDEPTPMGLDLANSLHLGQ